MPIELTRLPYAPNALEPHIDAKTVELHHGKHHAGYVAKANDALAGTAFAQKSAAEIIRNLAQLPAEKKGAITNNVCQAWNHDFYWWSMAPKAGGEPTGALADAITKGWGSIGEFQSAFSAAAAGQFGSGWGWLSWAGGKLIIETTANQDTPLAHGRTPLLVVDVWEHAYYLNYQNRRPDYIAAWWNLVNWAKAAERFAAVK